MENKEFAILHNTSVGQFLVNTTYNHEEDEHELSFKFWLAEVNGFATMQWSWTKDKEENYIETFERFRDIDFVEKLIISIKVNTEDE